MTWQELPSKRELATTTDGATLGGAVKSSDWVASSDADIAELLKNDKMVTVSTRTFAFKFMDKPQRGMTDSPMLNWTTLPGGAAQSLSADKGMTAEVLMQPSVMAHPLRGFDVEIGLKQSDGTMRRYLLSISPTQLRSYAHNEVRIIRGDADNARERVAYRIAVRPDGVAQVYRAGEKVTLLEGELLAKDAPEASYVRVGKGVEGGEYIATIVHAAFDTGGAFAP
jgi:hypothetical protein